MKGLAQSSRPARLLSHRVVSGGTLVRWGDQIARAGPWRADGSVAFLVPMSTALSADFVRHCTEALAEQGFKRVITGAIGPSEQDGFLEAGFVLEERLHLLMRDLSAPLVALPARPPLHRALLTKRRQLLEVDAACFSPFWQVDTAGLREVLAATERHRLRVALDAHHKVCGYAVCGAAGEQGFVQRIAVAPELRGRGIAKKLLVDGLYWLRSAGARQVAVNTQVGNEAALSLYRGVGFEDDETGLCVLSARLGRG
ncbi:MAG: GNAT family N-acetyltransferase [Acidimicrobiales bacterium]